ncbi:hypothetical protein G3T36_06175 [Diaminobutyricibacter tongyongensis]|uniref:Glycosyltransferase family 2 protein n=1 Tax=Leifsonia tongyongensis TaxID=1268043 RepID=A0A6L9XVP2_9MICO|nr:hypothetical protein [Diaminobutyricibacter tongyongensis]NEN05453.1 hypothetical protein [Diaminobutyricibacter tongyongensis]
MRPSRIILWVDTEQYEAAGQLPTLKRLVGRGLELRSANASLRSHKKYFHFVHDSELSARPLIIADDDLLYPHTWYRDLWEGFTASGRSAVISAWVKRPAVADSKLIPYEDWPTAHDTILRRENYFMGGSGTVFPVSFNHVLATDGDRFLSVAPTSDDAWLNNRAHRVGLLIGQSTEGAVPIRAIPGTQAQKLSNENLGTSGTNAQLAKLYESDDLLRLWNPEAEAPTTAEP